MSQEHYNIAYNKWMKYCSESYPYMKKNPLFPVFMNRGITLAWIDPETSQILVILLSPILCFEVHTDTNMIYLGSKMTCIMPYFHKSIRTFAKNHNPEKNILPDHYENALREGFAFEINKSNDAYFICVDFPDIHRRAYYRIAENEHLPEIFKYYPQLRCVEKENRKEKMSIEEFGMPNSVSREDLCLHLTHFSPKTFPRSLLFLYRIPMKICPQCIITVKKQIRFKGRGALRNN